MIRSIGLEFLNEAVLWGFQPVEAPALERLEILERKAGENVREEIYWFKDKSGREIGLIFDYTVPLARAIAAKPQLPKPIKWCYFGRVWRYDEPQAGRWREFWQFGVEYVGLSSVTADAEVLALMSSCLGRLKIDFTINLNDRRLVEKVLDYYDVEKSKRDKVLRILDKAKKVERGEIIDLLTREGVKDAEDVISFAETFLPLKDALKLVFDFDKRLGEELEELSKFLEYYGILEKVYLDCSIVRGLDYYTGLVFEVFGKGNDKWKRLALGGGGRYDELIGLYRKPGFPAVGFALGVDRIAMYLEETRGEVFDNRIPLIKIYPLKREFLKYSIEVAKLLRENGFSTAIDYYSKSLRDSLKDSDRRKVRFQVIIGEREYVERKITVKDLDTGKQVTLPLSNLTKFLKENLSL